MDGVLEKVRSLVELHRSGKLGGETMPEDENPGLEPNSAMNYMYFTLPMALNYQLNSYVLWECANRMFDIHPEMYESHAVCTMNDVDLRDVLVQYKVALQPNKQPVIWKTICRTIENQLEGDIRNLFRRNEYSVERIKDYISAHKRDFPYLGGTKICNYWLYVMEQHTDVRFVDREKISVAPDTHVIQASIRLGVITEKEATGSAAQQITANRWKELLSGTELTPIDVHTPLWLWSRGKFSIEP